MRGHQFSCTAAKLFISVMKKQALGSQGMSNRTNSPLRMRSDFNNIKFKYLIILLYLIILPSYLKIKVTRVIDLIYLGLKKNL